MKTKDLKVLVAELGTLTAVQHKTSTAALTRKGSAGDVVGLIEAEFAPRKRGGKAKKKGRAVERFGENFTPERCPQAAYRCGSM